MSEETELIEFDFDDGPREGFEERAYQSECVAAVDAGWAKDPRQLVVMIGGGGKCLGRGTPVLMFDGTIQPVEGIETGDRLMGPDSMPRIVQSTCRGREELFRVKPVKGDPYTVNRSHILSLQTTGSPGAVITVQGRRVKTNDIVDISVDDYFKASKSFRHLACGWRTGINFGPQLFHSGMPPYLLGVWLGDGNSNGAGFATIDPEILKALRVYAKDHSMKVRTELVGGKCPMYFLTTGRKFGRGWRTNAFKRALYELGILNNKHVPHCYLVNSQWVQREVLAGLLDTDGSMARSGYDYISALEVLADDVCFLARSLGLAAYKHPCEKTCGQNGKVGIYYRVSISGDCHTIPCRIARKKAPIRRQKKSVLRTGISVESVGEGDYFGFEISGDGRFLLGDFTVTHNTIVFSRLSKIEIGRHGRVLILADRDELVQQAHDKLKRSTGLIADVEKAEHYAALDSAVVIASIQSISRLNRLTRYPDDHFALVIADECDLSMAPTWQRVLNYFHVGKESLESGWKPPAVRSQYPYKARILGVTATPKETMGNFYPPFVFEYGIIEAVKDGYLCRPVTRNIPLKIDLRKVKLSKSPHGMDLDLGQIVERISPLIREIARALAAEARTMKTVVFMPSIETARQLSIALAEEGLNSKFVSGECSDRKEKIEWFRQAGRGSIICNAQLITRGFDVRDITAVCVLRPSRIWSFVVQCWLRGSRILEGVIDGCTTPEARRAAIDRSAKGFFTIFDFIWLADRIDIVSPVDLIATKPEIRASMIASGEDDLMASHSIAERDFLKALAEAARKHALKQARTLDPLAYAVSLGDDAITSYTPESKWEKDPATPGQLHFLRQQGMSTDKITTKGLANRLITRVMHRMRMHLATPRQLDLLRKLGLTDQQCSTLTMKEASATLDQLFAEKRNRHEPTAQEILEELD